ncbi:MAG: trimethylamine methyltransferase family protein [Bacteroidales bacterium]|nr:trimethylamine methyltransferase family protein [Bacteroidales bacterium]
MKTLNENQMNLIKEKTEDILENIGFNVMHKEILKIARAAGANVDEETCRVKIPGNLLRELISKAPSKYRITGIDGKENEVGGERQLCHSIITDPYIIDYETRLPRKPCLEDVLKHTAIAQNLEHIDIASMMDFPVTDYNDVSSSLRALEAHLLHFSKHSYCYAASIEGYKHWEEIARILLQEKDLKKNRILTVAIGISSPLAISEINCEMLLKACGNNFAIIPTICPMAGTTSPYSKIGTLVQMNAENLFLVALTQMINPGNPVLYHVEPSVSDMRTGSDLYYTHDKAVWKLASIELGKFYGLPTAATCGGSMNYRYDQQTGAEGLLFMLSAVGSQADIIQGFGSFYNAMGMSAEMQLIQTSWWKTSKHLIHGIDMNILEESLESIRRVGPCGNFLADEHTVDMLRSGEFFYDELYDYSGDFKHGDSMLKKAHNKVADITASIKSPHSEKLQKEIKGYFNSFYEKTRDSS